jgi:anaerobic selenocysteine-containing dehydrogenase
MAHVIVRERLYNETFVGDHTEGFDEFSKLVLEEYAPDDASGLTGLPARTIERLAREFAGFRPAVAVPARGLGGSTNSLLNRLAIHALNALAGSVDVPGGVLRPREAPFTPWQPAMSEEPSQPRLDGVGLSQSIVNNGPYLPSTLFLYETNPLFQGVGSGLWRGAFQTIPYIVSFSSFMDESTLHADLVLPNHTFLERWVDGVPPGGPGRATFGIGQPAVRPLYNTRHTGDILLELARSVGDDVGQYLHWKDFESLLRFRMRGLYEAKGSIRPNTDSFEAFWRELVDRGAWFGGPYDYGEWDEVLTTPSGRFHFRLDGSTDALSSIGIGRQTQESDDDLPTLPRYEPPSYAGDPEEFPLQLVPYRVITDAGCRAPNAPLLWEMYGLHIKEAWRSWVEIHPETAHSLGIEDEDDVWVESPYGRIRLRARLYEGAMRDAVNIPMGGGHTAGGRWAAQVGGGNVVDLVVPQTDPLSGSIAWDGTRVKVHKE